MSAEDVNEFYKEFKKTVGNMQKEMPDTLKAFQGLGKSAMDDAVLSEKVKEYVALGMALGAQCGPCIKLHVKSALEAGATREEILEVCGVAVMMGGGPAFTHIQEVFHALEANDG